MKDIFNPKRFGNYFLYDLRNAWQNFGLSAILLGLLPVMVFGIQLFFRTIIDVTTLSGDSTAMTGINIVLTSIAFSCWAIIMALVFPEKTYGYLTDKRAGTHFLLLPASSFEKTLSMILITGIIVPVVSGSIFFFSDKLLCLIPSHGSSLTAIISESMTQSGLDINFGPFIGICALSCFCNMMLFTLGSIFFKKGKAAKTLIAYIIISIVAAKILGIPTSKDMMESAMSLGFGNIHDFMDYLTTTSFISNGIMTVLLIAGIFFRIKTLKH